MDCEGPLGGGRTCLRSCGTMVVRGFQGLEEETLRGLSACPILSMSIHNFRSRRGLAVPEVLATSSTSARAAGWEPEVHLRKSQVGTRSRHLRRTKRARTFIYGLLHWLIDSRLVLMPMLVLTILPCQCQAHQEVAFRVVHSDGTRRERPRSLIRLMRSRARVRARGRRVRA